MSRRSARCHCTNVPVTEHRPREGPSPPRRRIGSRPSRRFPRTRPPAARLLRCSRPLVTSIQAPVEGTPTSRSQVRAGSGQGQDIADSVVHEVEARQDRFRKMENGFDAVTVGLPGSVVAEGLDELV